MNLDKHEIEVHRTPSTDIYKHITILRPGDSVNLTEFDVTIAVKDLLGERPN